LGFLTTFEQLPWQLYKDFVKGFFDFQLYCLNIVKSFSLLFLYNTCIAALKLLLNSDTVQT